MSYWVHQRRPHCVIRYRHGGYSAIYPWTTLHYEQHKYHTQKKPYNANSLRDNIVPLYKKKS